MLILCLVTEGAPNPAKSRSKKEQKQTEVTTSFPSTAKTQSTALSRITPYWQEKTPPTNHPPTVSCSADKTVVFLDSGEKVTVTASAIDVDNDPLAYSWTTNGGRIDGKGAQVRWDPDGVAAGTYTVTVRVDDGRGGSASCKVDIRCDENE